MSENNWAGKTEIITHIQPTYVVFSQAAAVALQEVAKEEKRDLQAVVNSFLHRTLNVWGESSVFTLNNAVSQGNDTLKCHVDFRGKAEAHSNRKGRGYQVTNFAVNIEAIKCKLNRSQFAKDHNIDQMVHYIIEHD